MSTLTAVPPATPFSVDPPSGAGAPGAPHAVVIGSGFGGLAAAVRLGARGYRVTVLERLDAPGGRAYVHRQDGFTFDAGPTIVTAPFLLEELWALCGRRLADDVELRPVDPFYRIRFDDGETFEYSGDPARMRAEVARLSPGDVAGYEAFMRASEATYRVGFEALGHVPFGRWTDMARVLPALLRLNAFRSVHGLVARHIRDPRLRTVFSFHPLLVGGNPFAASAIYSLIAFLERDAGVHFAMGGTGALVHGLVRLIEGQGGAVRCNETVSAITVRDGVATGVRRDDARGYRGVQRRCRLDLSTSAAGRGAPALDRPQDRAGAVFDEPVRLVFRHRSPIRGRGASHHPARAPLSGAAGGYLQASRAGA
jgi:phytoene desaturase